VGKVGVEIGSAMVILSGDGREVLEARAGDRYQIWNAGQIPVSV
jgi:hypothetical protein